MSGPILTEMERLYAIEAEIERLRDQNLRQSLDVAEKFEQKDAEKAELLALLEAMHEEFGENFPTGESALIDEVRAAIAKAEKP
jgi:pheromone shutdown protein TraB